MQIDVRVGAAAVNPDVYGTEQCKTTYMSGGETPKEWICRRVFAAPFPQIAIQAMRGDVRFQLEKRWTLLSVDVIYHCGRVRRL